MSRCLLMYAKPCPHVYPPFPSAFSFSQIPAYVYVNISPLLYSYTLIAIFICMVWVLFYTSTHNLIFSLLIQQI